MHSSVMFCNDVDFRQMLHGFCDAINQHKHIVTTRYGLKNICCLSMLLCYLMADFHVVPRRRQGSLSVAGLRPATDNDPGRIHRAK